MSKHQEQNWKYDAWWGILDEIRGGWTADETRLSLIYLSIDISVYWGRVSKPLSRLWFSLFLHDEVLMSLRSFILNYLFRRTLRCQWDWNIGLQWKTHSYQLNIPLERSMYSRTWYTMLSCSKRCLICRCRVRYQTWVRYLNSYTWHIADFDTESVWQDYIHLCCKVRRWKLYWLRSNCKNLKWRHAGRLYNKKRSSKDKIALKQEKNCSNRKCLEDWGDWKRYEESLRNEKVHKRWRKKLPIS